MFVQFALYDDFVSLWQKQVFTFTVWLIWLATLRRNNFWRSSLFWAT